MEADQKEQAKILYNLIQKQMPRKEFDINELMNNNITNNIESLNINEIVSESESDDDDSESDEDMDEVKCLIMNETVPVEEIVDTPLVITKIVEPEVKTEEEPKTEEDYSKMTMKQLKDILSQKGISSNPRMKKNDLINLIETGVTDTLNLSGDLTEVII